MQRACGNPFCFATDVQRLGYVPFVPNSILFFLADQNMFNSGGFECEKGKSKNK